MSKSKSMVVTIIVAILLGIAAFAAYRLAMPVFIILAAVFSGIGFLSAASFFCTWLEQESKRTEPVVEPVMCKGDIKELDPESEATYEEIKKESEAWG